MIFNHLIPSAGQRNNEDCIPKRVYRRQTATLFLACSMLYLCDASKLSPKSSIVLKEGTCYTSSRELDAAYILICVNVTNDVNRDKFHHVRRAARIYFFPLNAFHASSSSPPFSGSKFKNRFTSDTDRNFLLVAGEYQYLSVVPLVAPDMRLKVRLFQPGGHPPSNGSVGSQHSISGGAFLGDFLAGVVFFFLTIFFFAVFVFLATLTFSFLLDFFFTISILSTRPIGAGGGGGDKTMVGSVIFPVSTDLAATVFKENTQVWGRMSTRPTHKTMSLF